MSVKIDLRRFPRVPVERPVYVTTPAEGMRGRTLLSHELGEGGCLLIGDDFFGTGRILLLDIVLDAKRPARAIGKVLYEYRSLNGNVCSGVAFDYVEDEHLRRLKDYIFDRTPMQAEVGVA